MRRIWVVGFPVEEGHVWLPQFSRGPYAGKRNGYGGKGMVYRSRALYEAVEATGRAYPGSLLAPEPLDEGSYALPRLTMAREMLREGGSVPLAMDLRGRIDVDFEGEPIPLYLFLIPRFWPRPRHTAEMRAPRRFPVDRLPLEDMIDGDRLWVPDLLAGNEVHGDLVMRDGRCVEYRARHA